MSAKKQYIFFKLLICFRPFHRRSISMNFKHNAYRPEYSSSCSSQPSQFSSYTHRWSMFRRRSAFQNRLWHSIWSYTNDTPQVSHVHALRFPSTMGSSFTSNIRCIKYATVYSSPTHGFRIGFHRSDSETFEMIFDPLTHMHSN